jgi:hypothetical protein
MVDVLLDPPQNLDHGPEEHDHADPGDESAPGVFEHVPGELDDLGDDLLLGGEVPEQLLLEHLLEAEALGHAEGHGRQGDEGQQGIEGQGRGVQGPLAGFEAPGRDDGGPGQADGDPGGAGILPADVPEGRGEEIRGAGRDVAA